MAEDRFDPARRAFVRIAPERFADTIIAPVRFAPDKLAPFRFAFERSHFSKSLPCKSIPCRSNPTRFLETATMETTLCKRRDTYLVFAEGSVNRCFSFEFRFHAVTLRCSFRCCFTSTFSFSICWRELASSLFSFSRACRRCKILL